MIGAALSCAAAFVPATANAGGRVAVISSIPTSDADVVAKLKATGRFSGVDYINGQNSTPSLAILQRYTSVLVYDGTWFSDPKTFGDNLDAYLRSGGGVVMSVWGTSAAPLPVTGAFSDDYALLPTHVPVRWYNRRTLGTVLLPSDPLMAGVTSFDGGEASIYRDVALAPGAVGVAKYDNDAFLVAKRTINGFETVNLNFYPPSNSVGTGNWVRTTSGTTLMANALENVGRGVSPVPEPASWAMLALGAGAVGAALRRRRTAPRARGA